MLKRIFFISLAHCGFAFLAVTGGCSADIASQMELAQNRQKDGYYLQAESIYRTIITDRPGTSEAMTAQKNLILLYFKMDSYDKASQALGELIEDYSERSDLLDTLHEIVRKYRYDISKGVPGEAVESWCVQKQIQQHIDNPDMNKGQLAVRAINAMILIELKPANAVTEIEKLAADFSEHPGLPRVLWYLAEKYTKLDKYEKANDIYKQIAQRYPNSIYAGKNRLDFYKSRILFLIESEQEAKVQTAIDMLNTDFRGYPGLLSVLFDIATKYYSLEKYDDVVAIYKMMIEIDPHSELAAIAQRQIGWTYFASGNYDQAIEEYCKVISDFPESVQLASAQYWIAQSYNRQNDYERAITEYQIVISLYPNSREAIYSEQRIARIYRILDKHEKAISQYRNILTKYPDSPWATSVEKQIKRLESRIKQRNIQQDVKQ